MSHIPNLAADEVDRLVDIIALQAANAPGVGPQGYFKDLIDRTTLTQHFKLQLSGTWSGNAPIDGRRLINWALAKPINPADPRYTTIGSLLKELLEDVDLTGQRWIVSLIITKGLYVDPAAVSQLMATYNVPEKLSGTEQPAVAVGPEFDWWGSNDDIQLQSWLQPISEYDDVGVLVKVIERAASVCRVEFAHIDRKGTGFLIAPNLVVTNYHVLKEDPGEDLMENAKQALLYFGKVSTIGGGEAKGKEFRLVGTDPVVASSPVEQLDYALLRVDQQIKYEESIKPSPWSNRLPVRREALSILQHPMGKEMKLSRSSNGVVEVREDLGRMQYYTMAGGGSSGSPCFNKDWEIVAIHHAERAKGTGVRREGILFKAIHAEISQYL